MTGRNTTWGVFKAYELFLHLFLFSEKSEKPPSRQPYKTPYDKKKEREVMQLSVKVDKSKEITAEQQKNLYNLKVSLKQQQLELIANELR